jgi:tRNA (mo5U34)-methyltransferase
MTTLNFPALWHRLAGLGLESWQAALEPRIRTCLSDKAHGDFAHWQHILDALPEPGADAERLRELLLALSPWRKGPFEVDGVTIDAEWRSNLKWDRLKDKIEALEGRAVLDVGCGNGYYALQMHAAGARTVIGVDPTLLYVMQFLAIERYCQTNSVFALPLRLDQLPQGSRAFDTCFSMGVLYHQRSPIDHLLQLRSSLRQGGQLVLETMFVPGEEAFSCNPAERYARMRNVWFLPTIAELQTWLRRSGYLDIEIIDESITTPEEQRSTEWMQFESLREALSPDNPEWTVEGWPAPRRVIAIAKAP